MNSYNLEDKEVPISSANQITLPKRLRERLNLKTGDKVVFRYTDDGVKIERAETREEKILKVFAELDRLKEKHDRNMTPEQRRIAEMTKGWTINQFHEYFDNLPETREYIRKKYGV